MTCATFLCRSLRFYFRSHLGVILGSAVGSAALIGALVVGDSVRASLRAMALARIGPITWAIASQDRFFRDRLADDLAAATKSDGGAPLPLAVEVVPAMQLAGTAVRADGSARANRVQILGIDSRWQRLVPPCPVFPSNTVEAVLLNKALAAHLRVQPGDTVLLRMHKPSLLSRESPIASRQDFSVALRLKVQAVVDESALGGFNLHSSQAAVLNAFVPLELLQSKVDLPGRANLLLAGFKDSEHRSSTSDNTNAVVWLQTALARSWQLADAELELRQLSQGPMELRSSRVYLEPAVAQAASGLATNLQGVLTYFVNELRIGNRSTPYSMAAATGAPVVPPDLREDEIILNQWLGDDLEAKTGDTLSLTYFVIGDGQRLVERRDTFRVRSIIPLAGAAADRDLMPDFPGIAKAEKTENWDAGFPIQMRLIRPKDEQYWKDYRGTPKAFVNLAAGQRLWANRFGNLTALRFQPKAEPPDTNAMKATLLEHLKPEQIGLRFDSVRAQALTGAARAQDFGQLFLGFSFFLMVAALILMALLFQFGFEQRLGEVGTLLALGFAPRRVRRLLLGEGAVLAFAGGIAGMLGGLGYARAMVLGLNTLWNEAVGGSALQFHVTLPTLMIGLFSAAAVGTLTIALALRRQTTRSARELLEEGAVVEGQAMGVGASDISRGQAMGWIAGLLGLSLAGWSLWRGQADAPVFFGAGSLLLASGLGFVSGFITRLGRSSAAQKFTLFGMGLRGMTRRRKRSLASVALLACGSFLVVAIGAFKLEAHRDQFKRSSGTGGFAFIGETTLPIVHDLNSQEGQDFFGFDAADLNGASFVSMRVKDGDEASCLNLTQAQQPRLLGIKPEALDSRGAFTLAQIAKGLSSDHPWRLLQDQSAPDVVPAIGDLNSIKYAMGRKVGETIDYTDEQGRAFKVRLVAGLANSILQGSLLIDERRMLDRFPTQSGYRMFLMDAPSNAVAATALPGASRKPGNTGVAAILTRALQDVGLEMIPAGERLAQFNAVQNTYLNTFQVLGGLGLLLGSSGLGVVVLRNVLERRGELALLQAVGFRRRKLRSMILSEHGALLGLGLIAGVAAAAVAVLPALLRPGSDFPAGSLALTLSAVWFNGWIWTWAAAHLALRGSLLPALRNE